MIILKYIMFVINCYEQERSEIAYSKRRYKKK